MKRLLTIGFLFAAFATAGGCEDDTAPPHTPPGATVTGGTAGPDAGT